MQIQQLQDKILKDIKVELAEEFDKNFERKAFFNQQWDKVKNEPGVGSLMIRTGRLRTSYTAKIEGSQVVFSSDTPYASAHNEGATIDIPVTDKMRKWAWAMFYNTKQSKYKAMALTKNTMMKVKLPKRQVIGEHPQVQTAVENIIKTNTETFIQEMFNNIKFNQ